MGLKVQVRFLSLIRVELHPGEMSYLVPMLRQLRVELEIIFQKSDQVESD